jgi:SAM-dependent methyltransferase
MPENQRWNDRYKEGHFPWDMGGPAPSLVALSEAGNLPLEKGSRILIPGCGRGHDVLYLASLGFEAVGLDFAPLALEFGRTEATKRGLDQAHFVEGNFFDPPQSLRNSFDGLYELTCYCAIEPSKRDLFAKSSALVLKENGILISLLFPIEDRPGGPPYGVQIEDFRKRHEAHGFHLEKSWEPMGAHPARSGRVQWVQLRKGK